MSKALWFVIGLVVGDFAGRWLMHAVYLAIIIGLTFSHGPWIQLVTSHCK